VAAVAAATHKPRGEGAEILGQQYVAVAPEKQTTTDGRVQRAGGSKRAGRALAAVGEERAYGRCQGAVLAAAAKMWSSADWIGSSSI
jgi:hypothetical protein